MLSELSIVKLRGYVKEAIPAGLECLLIVSWRIFNQLFSSTWHMLDCQYSSTAEL